MQVGIVAAVFLAINLGTRTVSALTHQTNTAHLDAIGLIGSGLVIVWMALVGARWGVRYPFQRLFFDLGAASLIGITLSLVIGPFIGGDTPFSGGLGEFVGEYLELLGVSALGVFLGYMTMIVMGKDYRSRGLRRYEENYRKRPHRTVRG